MPHVDDRAARLYYDDGCGPCRFFARAAAGVSHHRVEAIPLDARVADGELGALPSEARYGYAHLASGDGLRTGEAIAVPLLGLAFGSSWERVARHAPFVDRALREMYRRAWESRRARGCGTDTVR